MNQVQSLITLLVAFLFSFANCQENYVIGSPYTLTWTAANISANTVDVILFYGDNLESNWTVAKNVSNNGDYDVDVNLTGTLIQFNIPNYSNGQFRLKYVNTTTMYMNVTEEISILQPVVLPNLIHGRVTPNVEPIDVYVNISSFLYEKLNFIEFYAEYITINGNQWVTNCDLNVTLFTTPSPTTASPTRAPTTFSPTNVPTTTTTSSPTTAPTTTTSSPTTTPTTTTSSPTATPTTTTTSSPTTTPTTTTASTPTNSIPNFEHPKSNQGH